MEGFISELDYDLGKVLKVPCRHLRDVALQ
jgi:hypothetical protein